MPSVATILIRARDEASDEIKKITREVGRLDQATQRAGGGPDLGRTLRGGAAATREMTQATGGLTAGLRSVAGTAANLAGVFGVAFGAQAVVQFGQDALTAANALEVTEARVRALAGSTDRYNEILALAQRGQQTYGGTLEENIAGLGALVNLSNRSGVAIETLDNAVRRLAAADPAQGIEGATVALREFLSASGSEALTSLAERFELPKDALRAFTAEGTTTAEKMRGLDQALNDLGYTNDFLAASTDTTAASFERLGSAWSNFTAELGRGGAEVLGPAADTLAGWLTTLSSIGTITYQVSRLEGERAAVLQRLAPLLEAAAAGSYENDIAVRDLTSAYYDATGAYADFTTGTALLTEQITALTPAHQAQAAAAYEATLAEHGLAAAHDTATAATENATAAALLEELQTRLQTQSKDELEAALDRAIVKMIESGDVSEANARKIAAEMGVTYEHIAALLQLANAYDIVRQSAMEAYRAGERLSGQGVAVGDDPAGQERALNNQARAQAQLAEEARKAQEAAAKKAAAAAQKAAGSARSQANTEANAAEAAAKREAAAAERAAKQAAAAAEREAEAVQKAQDDLLSDEERLAVYRERLAAGDMPESERLELMKQIRDLEEDITNEQEKQRRAAIDAALAAIDDRKARREEARELARAERVLASRGTSEEQKAAARDVLERIPLEQAKRAQEIADKLEQAGQAAPPTELTTMPVPTPATPVPVTIAQSTLPPMQLPAAGAWGDLTINATIVLPDGSTVGSGSATTALGQNVITDLRLALRATGA